MKKYLGKEIHLTNILLNILGMWYYYNILHGLQQLREVMEMGCMFYKLGDRCSFNSLCDYLLKNTIIINMISNIHNYQFVKYSMKSNT